VSDLNSYESTLEILKPFETGSVTESQLTVVTMKILQALENNLYGRFKLYKDSALSYIFLMNNIQYMVMFVRRFASCVLQVRFLRCPGIVNFQ
jgi:exocyst complex component 7